MIPTRDGFPRSVESYLTLIFARLSYLLMVLVIALTPAHAETILDAYGTLDENDLSDGWEDWEGVVDEWSVLLNQGDYVMVSVTPYNVEESWDPILYARMPDGKTLESDAGYPYLSFQAPTSGTYKLYVEDLSYGTYRISVSRDPGYYTPPSAELSPATDLMPQPEPARLTGRIVNSQENFAVTAPTGWYGEVSGTRIDIHSGDERIRIYPSWVDGLKASEADVDSYMISKGIRGPLRELSFPNGAAMWRSDDAGKNFWGAVETNSGALSKNRIFFVIGDGPGGATLKGAYLEILEAVEIFGVVPPTIGPKRLDNPENRFSLMIPAGWKGEVAGTHIDAFRDGQRVHVYPSTIASLYQSFEDIDGFYRDPSASMKKTEDIVIEGGRILLRVCEAVSKERWAWGVAEKNGTIYFFNVESRVALDEDYRRMLKVLLESFEPR